MCDGSCAEMHENDGVAGVPVCPVDCSVSEVREIGWADEQCCPPMVGPVPALHGCGWKKQQEVEEDGDG